MALTFTTLHGPWSADGETFDGDCTIEKPSKALIRLAGSAHAAGAITVSEGLDDRHVASQEDSEAALAEAMGDHRVDQQADGTRASYWTGPWQEGNCLDYLATRGAILAAADDPDDPFELTPEHRATIEANLAATGQQLEHWRAAQEDAS